MARPPGRRELTPIKDIATAPQLQMRIGGLNNDHADQMAAYLKEKKSNHLPRIQVRNIPDVGLVVTDGHHTLEAHRRAGRTHVPTLIQDGTWDDAIADAAQANNSVYHQALRMTSADKRRSAQTMCRTFPKWTSRRIAEHISVSHELVNQVRRHLADSDRTAAAEQGLPPPPVEVVREGRDGRTVQVKTETRPAPGKAPKQPTRKKSGAVSVDWGRFESALAILARVPDEIAAAHPGDHPEQVGIHRLLNETAIAFKGWKKRIASLSQSK